MPKTKDINLKEIAVLLKISHGEKSIAAISRELSTTIQGIRYYVQDFIKRGLITENLEITKNGVEFMHKNLAWVKDFLMSDIDELYSGSKWETISDGKVSRGDIVSLIMKDGYLHAIPGKSDDANAIATMDAGVGETLMVSNLEGIIRIKPGRVTVLYITEDRLKNIDEIRASIKDKLSATGKITIGIIGETARTIFTGLSGFEPIEYSAMEASFESAIRGVNAVVILSEFRMNYLYGTISKLKLKYKDIKIEIASL